MSFRKVSKKLKPIVERLFISAYVLRASRLVEDLSSSGIESVTIKGLSVASFYPSLRTRALGDFDLVINENRSSKALAICADRSDFNVDLHLGFRFLDTIDFDTLLARSKKVFFEGREFRILAPEDNLRVVCVHWLTDGGEKRHRLWDIYYMVKNRPADFDWDRCLNVVSKRRRRWIVCTIGLAHRYLGLDLSGTPIEEEAKDLPKWLTKRVEKEWKRNIPLIPLSQAKHSRKTFFQQIWKRLPPNPIMATIDCEGDFDARTRIIYQIRDIVKRLRMRREREGKR